MSDMPPPYTDQISPSEIQPKKVRDRKHRGCLLSVSQAHTPPHTCDISPDNSAEVNCLFLSKTTQRLVPWRKLVVREGGKEGACACVCFMSATLAPESVPIPTGGNVTV